jgi:hypothetical protein
VLTTHCGISTANHPHHFQLRGLHITPGSYWGWKCQPGNLRYLPIPRYSSMKTTMTTAPTNQMRLFMACSTRLSNCPWQLSTKVWG